MTNSTPLGFYEGPLAPLSNFSSHEVRWKGEVYKTAEHAYQVEKYLASQMKEKIKHATSAFQAREFGQAKEGKDPDWNDKKVSVMKEIMRAKLLQHEDVRDALQRTNNAPILKNHPLDYYWGTGADGSGKNVMGKLWEELREEEL